jgi:hypothetical protein
MLYHSRRSILYYFPLLSSRLACMCLIFSKFFVPLAFLERHEARESDLLRSAKENIAIKRQSSMRTVHDYPGAHDRNISCRLLCLSSLQRLEKTSMNS